MEGERKIKFIHIPKTSGCAFIEQYDVETMWHYPISKFTDPKDKFISIVRNPYSRFLSAFYHHIDVHNGDNMWSEVDKKSEVYMYKDPNKFIEELLKQNKHALEQFYKHIHFREQYKFLTVDGTNKTPIDPRVKILAFENLAQDKSYIKFNGFSGKHKRIKLNDMSMAFISEYYSSDFEYFGYHK